MTWQERLAGGKHTSLLDPLDRVLEKGCQSKIEIATNNRKKNSLGIFRKILLTYHYSTMSWARIIKLFTVVIKSVPQNADGFVTVSHFHLSLIFAHKTMSLYLERSLVRGSCL
jgi:hypothetical protein